MLNMIVVRIIFHIYQQLLTLRVFFEILIKLWNVKLLYNIPALNFSAEICPILLLIDLYYFLFLNLNRTNFCNELIHLLDHYFLFLTSDRFLQPKLLYIYSALVFESDRIFYSIIGVFLIKYNIFIS